MTATGLARRFVRGLLAAGLLVVLTVPAAAHRLKLFARVEAGEVVGEAFFVGGGRPVDVAVIVLDETGAERHRGRTDDAGGFRWRPDRPGTFTLRVDTGDGHFAETVLGAERFGGAPGPVPVPVSAGAVTPSQPVAADPADLARLIETAVDRAVERRTRPLLEALELAEARLRFNDVAGGVGMIVGLVGVALWVSSRRRGRPSRGEDRGS